MSQIQSYTPVGGGGGGPVFTLTGNTGGAVGPSLAGNINVPGESNLLTTAGNPGTNTLTVNFTTTGNNGQLIIGSTGNPPAWASLTSTGGTIAFTTGANTLNLESVGGVSSWVDVTGASQSMAVNTNYVADRGTLVTFTLPAVAPFGSYIRLQGYGAGGWTIHQNAGQQIFQGVALTTVGVGGSVSSTQQYDTIELLCTVANTTFVGRCVEGNLTYV